MLKGFGKRVEKTVRKAGKDAEGFVREVSQDVRDAVNSTVVEIATSGQLKQAQDRANNVNERLEALRQQLAPVQDQARDLLLDETAAATLDKAAIQERIKQIRILLKALETQSTAVAAWIDQIANKAEDGTSSRTGARNECEAFLGKQQADEKTFAVLEKQLQEMISAQIAALKPSTTVVEEDEEEEEENPLILLIQQRSQAKAAWEKLLNNPFFPSTLSKGDARAKIAALSTNVDKLIAGDLSVNIDSVKSEFETDAIMRAKLEAIIARQGSTSGVVAFSESGATANNGAGFLQVQAPLTTDTTLDSSSLRLKS